MTAERAGQIKAALAALAAFFTALWGWLGWLVVGWVAALALDWLTGTAAAIKTGSWSSKVARDGAWHKLGSVMAVLTAGLLDLVFALLLSGVGEVLPFRYTALLCPMVLVWYILTEAGSVVENAGALGAPLPAWLKRAIAALRDQVDRGEGWT